MIIFSDSEMASMIAIVRDVDIQGRAARLVVGIEDKLIAAAKLVQDDMVAETPVDQLEYEVHFDATELNALVQMTEAVRTKAHRRELSLAFKTNWNPQHKRPLRYR